MATHSSSLAWEIPQPDQPGGYSLWDPTEWDMTEHAHMHTRFPWHFHLWEFLQRITQTDAGILAHSSNGCVILVTARIGVPRFRDKTHRPVKCLRRGKKERKLFVVSGHTKQER